LLVCVYTGFNQMDCPVMHVSGKTEMFSVYEISQYFRCAFYAGISANELKTKEFDLRYADAQMREINQELRLLLSNLIVTRIPWKT
jgi:hypothetical protein